MDQAFAVIFGLGLIVFAIWLYVWYCGKLAKIGENMGLDYNWISYVPGLQIVQMARLAGWGWGAGWGVFVLNEGMSLMYRFYFQPMHTDYSSFMTVMCIIVQLVIEGLLWCNITKRTGQGWAYGLLMLIPIVDLFLISGIEMASENPITPPKPKEPTESNYFDTLPKK